MDTGVEMQVLNVRRYQLKKYDNMGIQEEGYNIHNNINMYMYTMLRKIKSINKKLKHLKHKNRTQNLYYCRSEYKHQFFPIQIRFCKKLYPIYIY